MLPVKCTRTPNFSEDVKLRFVRLLQEHRSAILTKVTSHNFETNKEKVVAWKCIVRGKVVRYAFITTNVLAKCPFITRLKDPISTKEEIQVSSIS